MLLGELEGSGIKVNVSSQSLPGAVVTVGSDDLVGIINGLIERENELSKFENVAISANVQYLGVSDSIIIDIAPNGRSAEIYVPLTGLRKRFEGGSVSKLQTMVEDYLKNEGSAEVARLRKEVNRRSQYGITDGSPSSSTALLAGTLLKMSGDAFRNQDAMQGDGPRSQIDFEYADWSASDVGGEVFFLRARRWWKVSDRSRLLVSLPIEYRTLGAATIYSGSLGLGYQFDLKQRLEEQRWRASVTPVGGAIFRGSEKLGAGGGLMSFGGNAHVAFKANACNELSLGLQAVVYDGIPIRYEGFDLDSEVEQTIAQASLTWDCQISSDLQLRTFLTGTDFLEDAGVSQFGSCGFSLQKRLPEGSEAAISVSLQKGETFEEVSYRVSYFW
ncbi:hypothetical protein [Pelagicoccus sp. SDUM812003]|uniref:hypothetical protein n=1 Tax=Pelagicoccus sp. SDUM812003 TaxID=3041267 RepID=UPI0028105885|nr:hypothetical protein [Pelagicoccus sp. SDUM812003]MDQ8204779.1 hypothetical protein [Pelagicoccus sp. SDUM812003]